MNLAMTVGTTTIKEKTRSWTTGRGRMLRFRMTLSAQPWIGNFKQAIVNGAVRLMASGAILEHRRVFPKEWPAPLGMTGVTVFIDGSLDKLRGIRRAVRIMTVRTSNLAFSKRHMGGTHELCLPLQMTLPTDFRLCALVKERGFVANLGKLISVSGLLHHGVASNAPHAAPRMRARFPVGLNATLVTAQTGFVLPLYRLSTVFSESDETTNALATTCRDMFTAGTVAILTSTLFGFVARVGKKNFPHLGLGKFLKLSGVASLANFVTNIGGRSRFLSRLLA